MQAGRQTVGWIDIGRQTDTQTGKLTDGWTDSPTDIQTDRTAIQADKGIMDVRKKLSLTSLSLPTNLKTGTWKCLESWSLDEYCFTDSSEIHLKPRESRGESEKENRGHLHP